LQAREESGGVEVDVGRGSHGAEGAAEHTEDTENLGRE
jgi:hypothetical protein